MKVGNKKLGAQTIPWLPDEEYQKSLGQLRLQLNGVFTPFNAYGLDIYIPGAKESVIKLCEDFALRVRGIDKEISFDNVKNKTGFRDK